MIILIFVTCFSVTLVTSWEEFYIIPSSSDACVEGTQCLTLSQFISRNIYVNYNVTLNFHSGNHTLSSTLVFGRNIVDLLANNYSRTRSDHDSVTITCNESGSVVFFNTPSARIQSIKFRSCLLQLFDHVHMNIINSSFVSSVRGQSQNAYLGYYWGYGKAGVIVSQRSSITLSDCKFERNQAQLGAAIFAMHSVIDIYNSSFMNNQAVCMESIICLGGVLYSFNSTITVEFSNFQNNSASQIDSQGGVFALFESSASIYNSNFANNVATDGSGGAIYAQGTNFNITACLFFNNTAA